MRAVGREAGDDPVTEGMLHASQLGTFRGVVRVYGPDHVGRLAKLTEDKERAVGPLKLPEHGGLAWPAAGDPPHAQGETETKPYCPNQQSRRH